MIIIFKLCVSFLVFILLIISLLTIKVNKKISKGGSGSSLDLKKIKKG